MTEERYPYRSLGGSYLPCPRCGDALLISGSSFVCGHDCGEWIELSSLKELQIGGDVGERHEPGAPEFPPSAFQCPRCKRQMESRAWGSALFDQCGGHGVWLAARFRSAFHMRIAAALEEEQAVRAIAEQMADAPEARRELARRILLLERRVALLERRAAAGVGDKDR